MDREVKQCVILAGGLGTRMRPFTEKIPKSLIPAKGKPFIHYQLTWAKRCGLERVVLCIGDKGEMIRDYVGEGRDWGVRIQYVDEGESRLGTGGALRFAADQGALEDRFLLTYGDSFLPIDFAEVAHEFARSNYPALMTVFHNTGKWDKSNVVYRDGVVALYDKVTQLPEMNYIDYGLSAMTSKVITERTPSGAKSDLSDLFHALSTENLLGGFEVTERFYQIGSHSGLADFESFLETNASFH